MKFQRVSLLLLAILLSIACMIPACAEETAPVDIGLTEVKIGSKVYSFSMPVSDFEAQGITFNSSELKPDYWYQANNGRASFSVLVSGTKNDPNTLSVCGVDIAPDGNQTFELRGGIVIGPEPCTKAQIEAAWGESEYNSYNFCYLKLHYYVFYNEDDTVRHIQIVSEMPLSYGFEYSELAGVPDENLPDPTTMAFDEYIIDGKLYKGQITLQDLVDDGWLLDSTLDLNKEVEPQGNGGLILNNIITCYNGKSMMQVFPINRSTDTPCKLSECGVLYMDISRSNNLDVTLADGMTLNKPYSDAVAVFGEASRVDEEASFYTHTVIGSVQYGFSVDSEGNVSAIRIQP